MLKYKGVGVYLVMLIGTYYHQLDQKNRFRIPAKLKEKLGAELVLTIGSGGALELFSSEELDRSVLSKMDNISLFDETAQKSLRILLSSAHELEEDNQGRFLLPQSLKSYAGILKNIVIIGVGTRLEIWAEEKWKEYTENLDTQNELKELKNYGV